MESVAAVCDADWLSNGDLVVFEVVKGHGTVCGLYSSHSIIRWEN
jgi:hypothetical protein